mmetsp:Transcript_29843/g.54666  ORF Transcript_29843/g.54666 Transcript_29843/m.54666 type:complete len:216 (-) Transcript_29843:337-984(-)
MALASSGRSGQTRYRHRRQAGSRQNWRRRNLRRRSRGNLRRKRRRRGIRRNRHRRLGCHRRSPGSLTNSKGRRGRLRRSRAVGQRRSPPPCPSAGLAHARSGGGVPRLGRHLPSPRETRPSRRLTETRRRHLPHLPRWIFDGSDHRAQRLGQGGAGPRCVGVGRGPVRRIVASDGGGAGGHASVRGGGAEQCGGGGSGAGAVEGGGEGVCGGAGD